MSGLVDAVQAELSSERERRPKWAIGGASRPSHGHELGLRLPDLLAVADAREAQGRELGYSQGYELGEQFGLRCGRVESREVVGAITNAMVRHLTTVENLLQQPREGRDRRQKDEIVKTALEQIDGVRAALAALRAAHGEGMFDAS